MDRCCADARGLETVPPVAGAHPPPEPGATVREIAAAGCDPDERIGRLPGADAAVGTAARIGVAPLAPALERSGRQSPSSAR
jgi:hypothetical protein